MSNILDKIIRDKQEEINHLYKEKGLTYFKEKAESLTLDEFLLHRTLSQTGLSLIAELKKASPSKGVIRSDFKPVDLAKSFMSHGASALSILTEKNYFLGDPSYISSIDEVVQIPILRKDFIVDPIQIYEAKCLGANAVLLIKAALDIETFISLHKTAHEIGCDVLVEIHDENELHEIKQCDQITIVGVNNRNLKTFEVDINTVRDLAPEIKKSFGQNCCIVAESGYSKISELEQLNEDGINAVLIGEGLAINEDLITYFSR